MQAKLLEVRDRGTFIPVIAMKLNAENEEERFLIARAGYGRSIETQHQYVLLSRLDEEGKLICGLYSHSLSRTLREAHKFIQERYELLRSGDVIDIEYILGETEKPKISERITYEWQ